MTHNRLTARFFLAKLVAVTFGVMIMSCPFAGAQEKPDSATEKPARPFVPFRATLATTQTFYFSNILQQNDANEIMVAIRSVVDPTIKIYLTASQNALVASAAADQMALIEKIIKDLDRPKKTYRLTFTIAESDGGKRIGVQHYSVMALAGQMVTLKQGSKVPVMTGALDASGTKPSQQIQYLDVGKNFNATLVSYGSGLALRAKVEQSSVAEEKSGVGEQDPVVRQSVLENITSLTLGKTSTIGSIDISGSTRHLDIEVMPELAQ